MNKRKAMELLGIDREYFDNKYLRRRYFKQCLKYHPDKNRIDNRFIEITEAYNYLKKENKSKLIYYDDKIIVYIFMIVSYVYRLFKDHINNYRCYKVTTSLDNILNKELLYIKDYDIYVPLWHNELLFETLNIKVEIEISLPDYIKIDSDNNILIYLNSTREYVDFEYGKIKYRFKNNMKKKVYKNAGIPIINMYNIYDYSRLSDIIFIF